MEKVLNLLEQNDLTIDPSIEEMVGIFDEEKLIAVGGVRANTLRCIAVNKLYQGGKVLNMLMSELIRIQYLRNVDDIFLFTKPSAKKSFEFLGFHVIEEVDNKVVLMENRPDGLGNYLNKLERYKVDGQRISAIVMNGNPFTFGHRYLIERASRESDHLHIFVLSSDESSFPYGIRMSLIKEGIKDIKNVTIHEGGNYIISNATFPSYFIKEKSQIAQLHTALDARVFGKYIGPCLGINRRYVGEEPYCDITNTYNESLKKILPQHGIEVKEIPRKSMDDVYISASQVRSYILNSEIEKTRDIVPPSTYSFLTSKEGEAVIKKIQDASLNRH